jgi:ketosteroid isomerase-like protein
MLKTVTLVLSGILLALSTGCASQTGGARADEMISSAKAVDANFLSAFNKGDADAVSALYWNSPDVVVYPPDTMECRGWQAVHEAFVKMSKDMAGAKLELIEPRYQIAGDYVLTNGLWKMTFPDNKEMRGRYTAVMADKDGKWVFVLDHPSVPLPPEPPPSR